MTIDQARQQIVKLFDSDWEAARQTCAYIAAENNIEDFKFRDLFELYFDGCNGYKFQHPADAMSDLFPSDWTLDDYSGEEGLRDFVQRITIEFNAFVAELTAQRHRGEIPTNPALDAELDATG